VSGERPASGLSHGLLLVGVLVVAANLRAVISAVGPVLPVIGDDTGMSPVGLGVLAAAPVAAFAVVSPLVHVLAQRFGVERTLFGSMLLLAAGTVIRSLPTGIGPAWPLLLGTVLIGAAVAVANVLLPVVARRDFPAHVPRITGYYIAVQSVVAGAASGLVVPLAGTTGSWRLALAVWGCLILVALLVWLPRVRSSARPPAHAALAVASTVPVSLWRSSLAWQVAGYFGLQSTSFYVLLSWLPTVEQDMGVSPGVAGFHLAVFLVVGLATNLAVPKVLTIRGDQRIMAALAPAWIAISMVGMLLVPSVPVVWVAMSGLALGASMVVALSLISLRAGGDRTTSRLSSMAQATAYSGVALGLLGAGGIRDVFGPGQHLLVYVLALAVCQLWLSAAVGRAVQLPA
jgi:CP family cyanate transporter-like MFS transporter